MIKFIAEIGINHNGDIDIAKKLIDIACFCNCWSVKFQKRNPEICIPEYQKNILKDTPWGKIKYIDYKKIIEFNKTEYNYIQEYCKNKILWSASVWDLDSLYFISNYKIPYIKIPSAHLNNKILISEAANICKQKNIMLISSCGMSTIEEINDYVDIIETFNLEKEQNILMYSNSSYPTKNKDLNLNRIVKLKSTFDNITIGYSDHAFGIIPSVTATLLGAKYIEKHITLDRTMWGTDQMCSLEPEGLLKLIKYINEIQESLGNEEFILTNDQINKMKELRNY